MTHNPECGLDCVSAGAVRGQPADANQQTGRHHLSGDQSAEQAKHTRGPWTNNGHSVYVYGLNGNVCVCGEPRASTIVGYTPCELGSDGLSEAVANARLIAASPTMLQALRQVRRFVETKLHSDDTAGFALGIIDHAVDQAEGRDR